MSIGGTTSGTNAGNYTATFTWEPGKTFTPSVSGYDPALMRQDGETTSGNAGSHTITYYLKHGSNYRLSDTPVV